jgi:hypothetical protein
MQLNTWQMKLAILVVRFIFWALRIGTPLQVVVAPRGLPLPVAPTSIYPDIKNN